MSTEAWRETMICLGLALAGFACVSALQIGTSRPADPEPETEAGRPRQKLTALNPRPGAARVRNLLAANALPSEIWAALDGCDDAELQELLNHLMKQPNGDLKAHLVLARWCERDPESATSAAAATRFPNSSTFLTAISFWGELDAVAAIDFVNQDAGNQNARSAYHAVLNSAIDTGKSDRLGGLLSQLPPERQDVKLYFELNAKAEQDPLAALLECAAIRIPRSGDFSDRFERDNLARPIIAKALAAGLAAEVLEIYGADAGRRLGEPPEPVIRSLYDEDPEAAIAWISDPRAPLRAANHGYRLAKELERESVAEAAGLLIELPPGKSRSLQIRSLAKRWAASEPEAVREWAGKLGDWGGDREAIEGMLEGAQR